MVDGLVEMRWCVVDDDWFSVVVLLSVPVDFGFRCCA